MRTPTIVATLTAFLACAGPAMAGADPVELAVLTAAPSGSCTPGNLFDPTAPVTPQTCGSHALLQQDTATNVRELGLAINAAPDRDGVRVALTDKARPFGSEVSVVNVDSRARLQVLPPAGTVPPGNADTSAVTPSLSPDGSRVVASCDTVTTTYRVASRSVAARETGPVFECQGIVSVGVDGRGLDRVIEGRRLNDPVYDGRGENITYVGPTADDETVQLWSVDIDGNHPRQLTDPSDFEGVGQPSSGPNGAVAFVGEPVGRAAGIFVREADASTRQLTVGGSSPSWTTDGAAVDFIRGGAVERFDIQSGEVTTVSSGPFTEAGGQQYGAPKTIRHPPFADPGALDALQLYKPRLIYDSAGEVQADLANTITDSYVVSPPTEARSNRLCGEPYDNCQELANADPRFPPRLTLDGLSALGGDYLQEAGTDEQKIADAQRLHATSRYGNKIYGREVESGGQVYLQYWFFYYYNALDVLGFGKHEGDWEMMQIELDSVTRRPTRATYAQHDIQETCPWNLVERFGPLSPVVYVAKDSQASYFTSGTHDRFPVADRSDGEGDASSPSVVGDLSDDAPSWLAWPGRWGGSNAVIGGQIEADSPRGPAFQGTKWDDPAQFANDGAPCGESAMPGNSKRDAGAPAQRSAQGDTRPSTRAAMPEVEPIERDGKMIALRYSFAFSQLQNYERPVAVEVSVDSVDAKHLPRVALLKVTGNRGLARFPRNVKGPGPYKVGLTAVSARGHFSRTVRTVANEVG